ncbi:MAG: pantoate--beta-alanine ligase [Candidatus Marinimicrobia bacterium]|jgi:pantoate--beta-alanine ligase|nr:pantoate--beta-alanine ligase [Candidatus Neomarinimicrobiota bacterium]|tara:strand:+ start:4209 stop:5051 length:843 start_codon:yes stop_codon:yes gene_type:complete
MRTITTLSEFKQFRDSLSGTIGFVPTMGALHEGHLSLVNKSNHTCDYTIVSIFVNPTQFTQNEDLSTYPKPLEKDSTLLKAFKVDAIFLPTNEIMYPEGFSTFVNEEILSRELEGKSRPSFFKGVTTIVAKLFNIVNPTHTFFGEKDAQQLRVIQKMVSDLNSSIQIISCSTVREKSGLAMSSRNEYLSAESRQSASIIYKGLKHGLSLLKNGERNPDVIREEITKIFQLEPLAKVDYISISDNISLEEINGEIAGDILISTAVYIDDIRLIDNITYSSD